ncbi:MAG: DUF883 C-terminal domain-containing protein [Hyphomicrobiales bacterium]|nr:DUF883 C-terminal domain-containing protein [Hyphomicrobiales bacterium]
MAEDMKNRARDTVRDTARDAEGMARDVKHAAGDNLDHMQDKMHEVKQVAEEKVHDLEAAIRKSPLTAAAIAAGVGFIFGAILSR